MNDSVSTTKAREMDIQWMKAGMPASGLRIVGYRIAGNRSRTFLTVPGNEAAPCYEYFFHNQTTGQEAPAYYHQSGPTLAEWQAQREATEASRDADDLYAWASGR